MIEKKIELIAPNLLLLSSLAFYIVDGGSTGAVCGLALGISLWLCALVIPRVLPVDKPTELIKRIEDLEKTVLENAQFSARELGTLNKALNIKQMNR